METLIHNSSCQGFSSIGDLKIWHSATLAQPILWNSYQSNQQSNVWFFSECQYYFHQLGHLGRVGLVVAISLCLLDFVCPLSMPFILRPLREGVKKKPLNL